MRDKKKSNYFQTTPRLSYSILYSTAAAILGLANLSVIQSPKSTPEVTPLAVIISLDPQFCNEEALPRIHSFHPVQNSASLPFDRSIYQRQLIAYPCTHTSNDCSCIVHLANHFSQSSKLCLFSCPMLCFMIPATTRYN